MKVFSKKKFIQQSGEDAYKEHKGWVDFCDGQPVHDGYCRGYGMSDKWLVDVLDVKPVKGQKEGKKMYTMRDFIEKKIAVRVGTGKNQKKFLEMCEKAGLRWFSGVKATERYDETYGEERCITYNYGADKGLTFCYAGFYKRNGYKIVEFKEIVEAARKRYEFKISVEGDVTTAEMIVDGKTVKTATAKRNPADKFDLATGARLAFDRLFCKPSKDDGHGFRVGDRVVCNAPTDGNTVIVGKHGRVIVEYDRRRVGVEFDNPVKGHTCDREGKEGHCWYCEAKTLTRE